MKHYLLFYHASDDYAARRLRFRGEHLTYAWEAYERGELVLAGAINDPLDGAVLLFRGATPHAAESFAQNDPYVTAGVVKSWEVREWVTVVGDDAMSPLHPDDV